MKVLYAASPNTQQIDISTGDGYQKVLLWFEDQGDWFVYFCDTLKSQAYIHKIINKLEITSDRLFSGFNFTTLTDEEFDFYEKWINDNYNYQGLHVDEKIDG